MSATDDVARMLTLVPWLLERPGATVAETAEAFGVSEAAIRADLNHLDFCGLPGLGGGDLFEVTILGDEISVRMADELRRPLRLTPRESLRLVLTAEAVAGAFGADLPALHSALDKIREAAGMPAEVSVQVAEDGSQWLASLREAITTGREVAMTYRGRDESSGGSERRLDPWALHVASGTWYVQGHDHRSDERRTFRLDRIVTLELLEDPSRHPRPEGELPPPGYAAGPDDLTVTLRVPASGAWLAEAIEDAEVVAGADGVHEVVFRTDAPRWAARLVLMGGPGVEVLAPPELAAAVGDEAGRALSRYDRQP